jgi:hypothetical protein
MAKNKDQERKNAWARKNITPEQRAIYRHRDHIRMSKFRDELRNVPCADCGRRYISDIMEFDHVPERGTKTTHVSQAGHPKAILEEAAKCDVVCANCHRLRTARRRGKEIPTARGLVVGFDLDGVLDRPSIRNLCMTLVTAGARVYIITGVFIEALEWQDAPAKLRKLTRLGIPFTYKGEDHNGGGPVLHVLEAVASTFDRAYRLADLGLRKGALCEELGISLFIEDSELYAEMIPKMSGATTVLLVR